MHKQGQIGHLSLHTYRCARKIPSAPYRSSGTTCFFAPIFNILCTRDPAGNRTTRRPHDHCKETQTAVVWSYLPFIRSGQNHLARHSERGKKTGQIEEEVGRRHQGMDRPGVRKVPEGNGEQGKRSQWRAADVRFRSLGSVDDLITVS